MIKIRGATVSGTVVLMPAPPTNTVVQFDPAPVWEGNNYFDAGHPTRVTVPNRRGGRYFIHAELQWEPRLGTDTFSVGQSNGGFFGAFIVRNGMTATSPREAQSTAPVIAGSGPLEEQKLYQDMAIELGLSGVYFVGPHAQPAQPQRHIPLAADSSERRADKVVGVAPQSNTSLDRAKL